MDTSPPPPPTPDPAADRSAQLALAALLVVLFGLLAARGYGHRTGARPTDPVLAGPDLATADRAELEQLPGVGPRTAAAIDDYRRAGGTLRTADDLHAVRGVGPKTVDKVRPVVRSQGPDDEPGVLEPRAPRPAPRPPAAAVRKLQPGDPPIDVNAASLDDLQRLPGVGPVLAQAIAAGRPFRTVDDLDRVKGIGPKTLDKLRPFVVVR